MEPDVEGTGAVKDSRGMAASAVGLGDCDDRVGRVGAAAELAERGDAASSDTPQVRLRDVRVGVRVANSACEEESRRVSCSNNNGLGLSAERSPIAGGLPEILSHKRDIFSVVLKAREEPSWPELVGAVTLSPSGWASPGSSVDMKNDVRVSAVQLSPV